MQLLFGLVSVVIALIGYFFYLQSIFAGKTKPHVFTWLVWGVLSCIVFVAQIVSGAGAGSYAAGITALFCLFIAGLSLRYGHKDIVWKDWMALFFAIVAIACWVIAQDPLWAVVIATVVFCTGYFPTFRKVYRRPYEENPVQTWFSTAKYIFSLFALESFTLTNTLYPVVGIIANLALIMFIAVRRRA